MQQSDLWYIAGQVLFHLLLSKCSTKFICFIWTDEWILTVWPSFATVKVLYKVYPLYMNESLVCNHQITAIGHYREYPPLGYELRTFNLIRQSPCSIFGKTPKWINIVHVSYSRNVKRDLSESGNRFHSISMPQMWSLFTLPCLDLTFVHACCDDGMPPISPVFWDWRMWRSSSWHDKYEPVIYCMYVEKRLRAKRLIEARVHSSVVVSILDTLKLIQS